MIFKYGRDDFCTNYAHGGAVVLAVLILLLCGNGWCICRTYTNYETGCANCECLSNWNNLVCEGGPTKVNGWCGDGSFCAMCSDGACTGGGSPGCGNYWFMSGCKYCSNECEADSLRCINQGNSWIPGTDGQCGSCSSCDEQCQCEEQGGMIWTGTECIEDTTICADLRAQCQQVKGVFSGSPSSGCCKATCDQCGALSDVVRLKMDQCCNQGMAPPDSMRQCRVEARQTCGMNWSTYVTTDNEFQCQDPSLSDAAGERYAEMCFTESSSSECEGDNCGPGEGSSSSQGGEGQSSAGGISSAGEYGDCEECPYLDSILDTIKEIKFNTDDIVLCLTTPGVCAGLSVDFPDSIKTPVFHFDTAFRKYLEPLMDSMLKVDSNQLRALLKLDTNQLKMLAVDSVALKNDTLLRYKMDALGNVIDTSVHSMNDTTRKWFKRLADSIGVSTDSLAAHIDSIIRHIPDTILDSISKYQKFANDNFDSVLYGTGKGFSLVDSLIDSAVHYFKMSGHYDSLYRTMFADSLAGLHGTLDDIPSRNASAIGSALGYGDTATSTLRGDLEGIRGAIEGLGDGIGSGVAGALDSAIGSGSGADTVGVGYGWLADGDALADSIIDGSGYGGLDFAGDSSLRDSLLGAGYVCDDTSCCVRGECFYFDSDTKIQDSLARFVSAYGDTLAQKNSEYLSDSVSGIFQDVKESLMVYNPVGIFDSTVLSTLGMKIPNTNTCPEHCSKFEVDIPFMFGTQHFTIDYGLCLGRAAFADGNVLSFLRFIIRVVVAFTCISAVMWNAARLKR